MRGFCARDGLRGNGAVGLWEARPHGPSLGSGDPRAASSAPSGSAVGSGAATTAASVFSSRARPRAGVGWHTGVCHWDDVRSGQ